MSKNITTAFRGIALMVLVSGLLFLVSPNAVFADPSGTSPKAMGTKDHSPQAMQQHVEDRIKTLHDKLGITDAQEAEWAPIAQIMRDNESAMSQLIQARHDDPQNMSAVDDLLSYQKIAEAHVDGLKNLIPAFQTLYNDMSDDQKKIADGAFSHYEGHGAHASAKKHS